MVVRLRPAVATLPVYSAGKPAPQMPDRATYKLSSNENPYPPLPGVIEATMRAVARMNVYPDPGNMALTEALAGKIGVNTDQLAFGTGSVAVLYHLLQAVCDPGDEVMYAWRSFEAYPIAVQLTGATSVQIPLGPEAEHDLGAIRAAVTEATKVIMICTPNNPTGPVVDHEELIEMIDSIPDHIMIIIDEAYVEFVRAPGAARGLDALRGRPNVVVLRTFSKAYGLAGFRIGFCVAEPSLARAIRGVSMPFGVSIGAQAAAVASLAAEAELLDRVDALVRARSTMRSSLLDLGLEVPEAQGNFLWLPAGAQTAQWAEAFTSAGLIVRPYVTGKAGDGLRISIGESQANSRVLEVAATLQQ